MENIMHDGRDLEGEEMNGAVGDGGTRRPRHGPTTRDCRNGSDSVVT